MNEKHKIIVLTTGGTIDKSYDESNGHLYNKESQVKQAIEKRLRLPYTEFEIVSIMAKDSLEMDEKDREFIKNKVLHYAKGGDPIIVIHGTDTMQLSAEYLEKNAKNLSVPVIFTGAMSPIGVEGSDAIQNVVEALFATRFVNSGIFISFHNRLYKVPGVRKNLALRTFEAF